MLNDALKVIGKAFKLGVAFEVVDDPEDSSKYLSYLKPVDVWLFPSLKEQDLARVSVTSIAKSDGGVCIRRVSKATPQDLRTYGITSLDGSAFLYVIAAPTPEWAHLYDERKYAPIPVRPGNLYNFAVSLPPKA